MLSVEEPALHFLRLVIALKDDFERRCPLPKRIAHPVNEVQPAHMVASYCHSFATFRVVCWAEHKLTLSIHYAMRYTHVSIAMIPLVISIYCKDGSAYPSPILVSLTAKMHAYWGCNLQESN